MNRTYSVMITDVPGTPLDIPEVRRAIQGGDTSSPGGVDAHEVTAGCVDFAEAMREVASSWRRFADTGGRCEQHAAWVWQPEGDFLIMIPWAPAPQHEKPSREHPIDAFTVVGRGSTALGIIAEVKLIGGDDEGAYQVRLHDGILTWKRESEIFFSRGEAAMALVRDAEKLEERARELKRRYLQEATGEDMPGGSPAKMQRCANCGEQVGRMNSLCDRCNNTLCEACCVARERSRA